MKRRYAFAAVACLGLLPLAPLFSHESTTPTKEAKSKIAGVTVYTNTALVTRDVEVPEGVGLLELVVTPLPTQVMDGSLYSEGNDGIRVLTTRYRMRAIEQDTSEAVKKVNDERKKLNTTRQELSAKQKVITDNLALLSKLEGFTAATMQHLTEKGVLSADQTISLSKFIMETRSTKSEDITKLVQQLQLNQEADEFLQRKLREVSAGPNRTEREAVITINKANNGAGKIRLNYLVSNASWSPQYKFRAGKEKEAVNVEYLAAIRQQSGEEWGNVNITLSTAQPMLNAAPPDLKALTMYVSPMPPGFAGGGQKGGSFNGKSINFGLANPQQPMSGGPGNNLAQQPVPPPQAQGGENGNFDALSQARDNRQKAQMEVNKRNFNSANVYWNEAAAAEQRLQLLTTKEEEKQVVEGDAFGGAAEGPTVTYKLPAGISIPSRPDEQIVEVTRLTLPPEYYYKAIPVLTKHVYRLANLTNKSDLIFLPGEATMYQGSDFVGRTQLPLVAIGERFTVGFGIDTSLQVNRKLVEKTRSLKGGNQELNFEYRILVNSYKPEPVNIQVWDRLPMTESEVIAINITKTTPEICKDAIYQRDDRTKNLLRWDVTVAPNTFGEKATAINYQFKMELDKTLQVGALSK